MLAQGYGLVAEANAMLAEMELHKDNDDAAGTAGRPTYTTSRNCNALHGKTFRSLAQWAARRGIPRFTVGARTPAFKTADIDAAIAATAQLPAATEASEESLDDQYLRLVVRAQ